MKPLRVITTIQGVYYLLTGLWPIIDIRSFMAVTGPKTDIWLVQTVGALLIPIAACLLSQRFVREQPSVILLGILTALAFAFVDFYFPWQGTIRDIYMVDGIFQILLLIGWVCVITARKKNES